MQNNDNLDTIQITEQILRFADPNNDLQRHINARNYKGIDYRLDQLRRTDTPAGKLKSKLEKLKGELEKSQNNLNESKEIEKLQGNRTCEEFKASEDFKTLSNPDQLLIDLLPFRIGKQEAEYKEKQRNVQEVEEKIKQTEEEILKVKQKQDNYECDMRRMFADIFPYENEMEQPRFSSINDTEPYEHAFEKYRNSTILSGDSELSKPLCIYAINQQYDDTGAVLGYDNLNNIMYYIKNLYEKFYTVIPIFFYEKEDLCKKLNKYSDKFKMDISLCIISAHSNSVTCLTDCLVDWQESAKLSSVLKSQLILEACNGAGNKTITDINQWMIYKLAVENPGLEVFGATDYITVAKPNIELINEKPIVKNVDFFIDTIPVNSWKIRVLNDRDSVRLSMNN